LATGRTAQQVLSDIGQVVEGYTAAQATRTVAQRMNVEMPLCEGVYRVLYEGVPARDAVRELMTRPIKSETD
jgi:glycerol-3-phosphate dehydrogenase (NAD(P)+)